MIMRKLYYFLAVLMGTMTLTGCLDSSEEPDTEGFIITSPTSIGETNTTIYQLKKDYYAFMSNNNTDTKIDKDLILEGVVVANDDGGNLYQTLIIRDIDDTKTGDAHDQCIQIGIRNTWLSPYFKRGQRIKINLNGLWVGNYSKTPKIGQPYYTSAGNRRLGPMLFDLCATNIELVGKPDPNAPELTPIDCTEGAGLAWLKDDNNQNAMNSPRLVTVKGIIAEVQGKKAERADTGELSGEKEPLPKIFAPEALYDAGYAVDRTLNVSGVSGLSMTIRTSTQNDISFLPIPSDERSYTGILTYYSGWQMQLRHVEDIYPAIK